MGETMRFEAVTAWLVALLLRLAQALALGGDGGEDAALKLSKLPSKLSELPPDQVLLQDWEDYALSPELLQPLTEPPLTTTTIKNQDGRDGCPAEQPSFFWRCDRPRWQGCGYGEECCCGKCHPKYMVYCNSDGYWGEAFFHDACMAGCPTEPTTTTSTETPELDLALQLALFGPGPAQILQSTSTETPELDVALVLPASLTKPAQILQDHLDPDCWGMNQDGVMVSCYEPPEALLGTLVPQITTGTPAEGHDCGNLEQRIAELEREKTRLKAQRSYCPSSSSSATSSSAAAPTMIPTSASPSQRHSTNLPWFGKLGTTTDNVNG